ncbi:nucleoporin NUP42 [Protopterus annectens]|uniref:nucleoporin NUP42 n=1 Tax=Protopterus annectens TaxID=7888 RepID=UPI001CF93F14|nr:nucleoporin NUP42 [Protopterus annectens]
MHPSFVFKNIIKGQAIRTSRLNPTEEGFCMELENLKGRLIDRGYDINEVNDSMQNMSELRHTTAMPYFGPIAQCCLSKENLTTTLPVVKFTTAFTSDHSEIRDIISRFWAVLQIDNDLKEIVGEFPKFQYKNKKNLKRMLCHSKHKRVEMTTTYTVPCGQCFSGSQGGYGSWSYRYPQYSAPQASNYSKQFYWSRDRDDKSNSGSYFSSKQQDVEKKGFQKNDTSSFSFSLNRFSALNSSQSAGKSQDDDEKLLESIKYDLEVWESSGQWPLSTYCPLLVKQNISGFMDISPEELRHQWYTCTGEGTMQNYITSVQQLINQWKSRLLQLKTLQLSSKASLIAELMNTSSQIKASPGFGAQQTSSTGKSGFATGGGSSSAFSFKAESVFGSSVPASAPVFGATSSQPAQPFSSVVPPAFGTSLQPAFSSSASGSNSQSSSFGTAFSSAPGNAASFSFIIPASPGTGGTPSTVFGASAASGFGSSSFGMVSSTLASTSFGETVTSATGGLGFSGVTSSPSLSGGLGVIGSATHSFSSGISTQHTGTVQGQSSSTAISGSAAVHTSEKLFTPQDELTADELREFKAKRFSLGMIPLRPPPKELLVI